MKKRIKKKHLYMKLEDVCESIVETIPVPDHSTLLMRLDPSKSYANFGFKSEWNKLVRITKVLKRNHDIDVVAVPTTMFDVVHVEGRIPYDKLMEKINDLKEDNSDEQTHLKVEDVCNGIVERMTLKDHSTIMFEIDCSKVQTGDTMLIDMVMAHLKEDHDIDSVLVPKSDGINIVEMTGKPVVKPAVVDGQEISLDASVPKDLKRG